MCRDEAAGPSDSILLQNKSYLSVEVLASEQKFCVDYGQQPSTAVIPPFFACHSDSLCLFFTDSGVIELSSRPERPHGARSGGTCCFFTDDQTSTEATTLPFGAAMTAEGVGVRKQTPLPASHADTKRSSRFVRCASRVVGCLHRRLAAWRLYMKVLEQTVLLALLCAMADCAAQTKPHTVSGQVVNSVTGEPIARAEVQFGAQHAALTDHEGRYQVDGLTENYDQPLASKPGYFPADGATQSNRPGVVELVPEAILSGTVLDDEGHAVQDLSLQLTMLLVRNGRRSQQGTQSATTNVEGEFRFAGLQAGRYQVTTNYRLEGLMDAPSSVAFLPTRYPADTGGQAEGAVALPPGSHVQADLTVVAEKIYPVTGMVTGPIGAGMALEVQTAAGEVVNVPLSVFPDGTFRLSLPSGSFRLKATAFAQPRQLQGSRQIEVNHGPLAGVTIGLATAATLQVEVANQSIETGNPQQTPQGAQPLYLSLENEDPHSNAQYPASSLGPGQQKPDGPLAIQGVPPGRYRLVTQPSGPWYVASASCGGLDLMQDTLVVSEGSGICTLQVVLRNDFATLKWSVVNGPPGPQGGGPSSATGTVFVEAIPLDSLAQPETATLINGPGYSAAPNGEFQNLRPGHYLVVALPIQKEIAFRDPAVLKTWQSLGQEVTLGRSGQAEVQLQMAVPPPDEP